MWSVSQTRAARIVPPPTACWHWRSTCAATGTTARPAATHAAPYGPQPLSPGRHGPSLHPDSNCSSRKEMGTFVHQIYELWEEAGGQRLHSLIQSSDSSAGSKSGHHANWISVLLIQDGMQYSHIKQKYFVMCLLSFFLYSFSFQTQNLIFFSAMFELK